MLLLAQANAFQIPLPDKSVHCAGTSPPYYSLRKYAGEQEFIFGGDKNCVHEFEAREVIAPNNTKHDGGEWKGDGYTVGFRTGGKYIGQPQFKAIDGTCRKCNAWRGAYGLEPTLQMYIDHTVEWCREVWRVLRDDGTFWLNMGDSYAGSGKGGQSEEKRSKNWQPDYPHTAMKPSYRRDKEPVPKKRGMVHNLKPKDLMGVPWRVALALQADGWYLRSDIIWAKPNPMPESVTDRPTKAHEYLFLLTKKPRYYYDADAVREKTLGSNAPKPEGKIETHDTYQPNNRKGYGSFKIAYDNPLGRNKRTVWTIATAPYSDAHFATFPPALIEPCIKAGTSERGVCPECGEPWERVTQKIGASHEGKTDSQYKKSSNANSNANRIALLRQAAREQGNEYESVSITLGWRPMCDHYNDAYRAFPRVRSVRKKYQQDTQDEWFKRARKRPLEFAPCDRCAGIGIDPEDKPEIVCSDCLGAGVLEIVLEPALVLDPFIGSGTTLIVARKLGRHGIGLDISMDYLKLASKRLGLKALQSWEAGQGKDGEGMDLSLLPLWSAKEQQ